MSKQRDPHKERFWRRLIKEWRRSRLSVGEFCAAEGLSEASLYAWRRILAERDAQAIQFVSVRVISGAAGAGDHDTSSAAVADANGSLARLELIVAGGQRLRIGPGFDEATLRRVLAILQEGRPCS